MTMVKLFVGNLSFEVMELDLRAAFAAYGPVGSVEIVNDRSSGEPRGFAFVEMSQMRDAMAAIAALNGSEFGGRLINVSRARPRRPSAPRNAPDPGWAVVGSGRHRW
jgi:RNA recognition motif-containing protein